MPTREAPPGERWESADAPRLTPPPRVERRDGSGRGAGPAPAGSRWSGPLLLLILALAAGAVLLWLPGAVRDEAASAARSTPPDEPPPAERAGSPREADPAPEPPAPEPAAPEQGPGRRESPGASPAASPGARASSSAATLLPAPAAPPAGADPTGSALSEGLEALAARDWTTAEAAFTRALALDPSSGPAAEGLGEARRGLSADLIRERVESARRAEDSEAWSEALVAWQAALALDPTVKLAQEGGERAASRAELAAAIAFHLDHPERLVAPEVLVEAEALLARAEAVDPAGDRHRDQVAALGGLLERARREVSVVLSSDGETEVTILRVGRLGRFTRHELELRPGVYTIVGTRSGYRDVRRRLEVPGESGAVTLDVRCTETF